MTTRYVVWANYRSGEEALYGPFDNYHEAAELVHSLAVTSHYDNVTIQRKETED